MKIRKSQMKVYEIARFPAFENQMLSHIELNFNDLASMLGQERTKILIHHGYKQAVSYGFITAYEITLFIDLMFHLGPDFDTDPKFQWAQGIFDTRYFNSKEQMEILYHTALDYVEKMTGEVDSARFAEYELNLLSAFELFFPELKKVEINREHADPYFQYVSFQF